MTKITEALDRIARQCSVKPPSSWVSATREDHKEVRDDFFDETIDDILDRLDLPLPIGAQVVISTLANALNSDGSRTFTLPSTFRRIHRGEWAVYDADQDRPCVPIESDGLFTFVADTGTAGVVHFYKIEGYDENHTITFYSDPGTTSNITLSYSTFYWMKDSGGTSGKMFTDEDDILLLPRRIVESGTVWRFRERKGLPYLDKYNEYEALLSRLSNDSRTRRKIDMGTPDKTVRWQDMIPAFIPSS